MRISYWSSDVCSSDLAAGGCDFHFRLIGTGIVEVEGEHTGERLSALYTKRDADAEVWRQYEDAAAGKVRIRWETLRWPGRGTRQDEVLMAPPQDRSEERWVGQECGSTCSTRWEPVLERKTGEA